MAIYYSIIICLACPLIGQWGCTPMSSLWCFLSLKSGFCTHLMRPICQLVDGLVYAVRQ